MSEIKIDRLIGIITILLQKDKVTAPFLAERFEVSRRTINRDIENICKAGIPIVTMQGYDGGISIADGYKIDKTVFTSDELQSIFIGLKGLESVSDTAHTNKLMDKLSYDKNSVVCNSDNILIDLASHYKTSLTEKIGCIKLAIKNGNLISFKYYSNKGEAERIIEPYLLVFKWSAWYVFGYSVEREDFRLFKLNRLDNLIQIGEYFKQRDVLEERLEFDRYFSGDIKLVALFNNKVKYRLIEEYGVDSFTYTNTGKLKVDIDFVSKENLLSWVLSFGDMVQVIEPKELRLELRNHAKNMLQRYEVHDI